MKGYFMNRFLEIITKNTLEIIFSILGTEIVYYSFYRQFNILYVASIIILNIILFVFYHNIIENYDKGSKIYLSVFLILIVFIIGLIKFEEYNSNISFSTWIFNGGYLIGDSVIYEITTLIFSTLVFSSMFFYFTIKVLREHILILLVFIVIIVHMKCVYNKGNIFVYLFIASYVAILFNRSKSKKMDNSSILILVSIFVAAAYYIPNPKSLPTIKPFQHLKEYFCVEVNSGDESGFNVELNKERNISKSTSDNPDTVIYNIIGSNPGYLVNHNFDDYIDNEWKLENNELYLGRNINRYDLYMPINFTINRLSKSDLYNIAKANYDSDFNKTLYLKSCNYITSQISHPANTVRCQVDESNEDVFLNGYEMLFNRNVDYFSVDNSYKFFYTDNNPDSGSKEDLIMRYFNEDRYKKFLEQVCTDKEKNDILSDMNESISPYTKIHANISKDVIRLSKNITKDYESNYDKAAAIEGYLKSEPYVYDLSIPEATDSNDYINYFILQGKRGYCIQYATAMTIMCRASGIPARYVEGYLVSKEQSNDKEYEVKESDAHAFVEVYIHGFGWKIFDPTPSVEKQEIFSGETSTVYAKYYNMLSYKGNMKYIFTGIMFCIFAYVFINITRRPRIIRKIKKKENEYALEGIIANSIQLLKELNINVLDDETEMQFASRVLEENNINLLQNVKDYYKYKYNNEKVSNKAIRKALDINKKIYRMVKKSKRQKIIMKLKVIKCLKK